MEQGYTVRLFEGFYFLQFIIPCRWSIYTRFGFAISSTATLIWLCLCDFFEFLLILLSVANSWRRYREQKRGRAWAQDQSTYCIHVQDEMEGWSRRGCLRHSLHCRWRRLLHNLGRRSVLSDWSPWTCTLANESDRRTEEHLDVCILQDHSSSTQGIPAHQTSGSWSPDCPPLPECAALFCSNKS